MVNGGYSTGLGIHKKKFSKAILTIHTVYQSATTPVLTVAAVSMSGRHVYKVLKLENFYLHHSFFLSQRQHLNAQSY
jgi:hypothetical protein